MRATTSGTAPVRLLRGPPEGIVAIGYDVLVWTVTGGSGAGAPTFSAHVLRTTASRSRSITAARPDGVVAVGTGENEEVALFEPMSEVSDSAFWEFRSGGWPCLAGVAASGPKRERNGWINRYRRCPAGWPVREELPECGRCLKRWHFQDGGQPAIHCSFYGDGRLWDRRPPELEGKQASWDVCSPDDRRLGQVEAAGPALPELQRVATDPEEHGMSRTDARCSRTGQRGEMKP